MYTFSQASHQDKQGCYTHDPPKTKPSSSLSTLVTTPPVQTTVWNFSLQGARRLDARTKCVALDLICDQRKLNTRCKQKDASSDGHFVHGALDRISNRRRFCKCRRQTCVNFHAPFVCASSTPLCDRMTSRRRDIDTGVAPHGLS